MYTYLPVQVMSYMSGIISKLRRTRYFTKYEKTEME